MNKPWYESWTIWFNIAALAVELCNDLTPMFPAGQFHQILAFVLILGNAILRFKTWQGIDLTAPKA